MGNRLKRTTIRRRSSWKHGQSCDFTCTPYLFFGQPWLLRPTLLFPYFSFQRILFSKNISITFLRAILDNQKKREKYALIWKFLFSLYRATHTKKPKPCHWATCKSLLIYKKFYSKLVSSVWVLEKDNPLNVRWEPPYQPYAQGFFSISQKKGRSGLPK